MYFKKQLKKLHWIWKIEKHSCKLQTDFSEMPYTGDAKLWTSVEFFVTNSAGTTENPSAVQREASATVPKVYIAWTMDDFAFLPLKNDWKSRVFLGPVPICGASKLSGPESRSFGGDNFKQNSDMDLNSQTNRFKFTWCIYIDIRTFTCHWYIVVLLYYGDRCAINFPQKSGKKVHCILHHWPWGYS